MRSLQSNIRRCASVRKGLGIAAVVALAGFYLAGYRPAAHRLAALDRQIAAREAELAGTEAQVRILPELKQQLARLQTQVRTYDRQFPAEPRIAEFLRDVTRIGQQLALQECKYEQAGVRRTDAFCEQPIQLRFHGDFLRVASFLRQVEDLQRLTRIRRLVIRTRPAPGGEVDVEMAMNIYYSEG